MTSGSATRTAASASRERSGESVDCVRFTAAYTFLLWTDPMSPLGLMKRTTIIRAKAKVLLSWVEM